MYVVLSGATGFVGRALCHRLKAAGHRLGVVSRDPRGAAKRIGIEVDAHDSAVGFSGEPVAAVINLAGAPIFGGRWSESRKRTLIDSRVAATADLVALCRRLDSPPAVMISASAMGYYGDQGEREVDEATPAHDEFAHRLCALWEQAAKPVESLGMRLVIARFGLVLDPEGGMLRSMLPAVRFGAGARLGDGCQFMPWIARSDLVEALVWLLEDRAQAGVFNLSAPRPLRNAEFMAALGRALHRPVPWRIPARLLELGLGEMSRMLLTGADMRPRRLLEAGFEFSHPELDGALAAMLGRERSR
ncbi:TIGR01777 family oxidoreductase [Halotalea alkalilenta]|uniref:Epimerase n=1 Tax=Halotalea alkalilenta TaxID=376489 RepID=A0A172YJD1_9GAMM|nr:TIGR01777 family oxidoreductase [Halotalea alkalilenta]ANF59338.1 epimerase [Halotalea alkalilenta]